MTYLGFEPASVRAALPILIFLTRDRPREPADVVTMSALCLIYKNRRSEYNCLTPLYIGRVTNCLLLGYI